MASPLSRSTAATGGPQRSTQPATRAAEELLKTSCACPLESFVTILPAKGSEAMGTRRGILRYVGPTDFADGVWAGVELVGTLGRNNGFGKSNEYFKCLPGQGVFVRPEVVQPFAGDGHGDAVLLPSSSSLHSTHKQQQQQPSPPPPESRRSSLPEEEEAALALMEELESKLLAAERESKQLREDVARLTSEREDALAQARHVMEERAVAAVQEAAAAAAAKADAEAAITALKVQLESQSQLYETAEKDWRDQLAKESEKRKAVEAHLAALLSSAENEVLDDLDVETEASPALGSEANRRKDDENRQLKGEPLRFSDSLEESQDPVLALQAALKEQEEKYQELQHRYRAAEENVSAQSCGALSILRNEKEEVQESLRVAQRKTDSLQRQLQEESRAKADMAAAAAQTANELNETIAGLKQQIAKQEAPPSAAATVDGPPATISPSLSDVSKSGNGGLSARGSQSMEEKKEHDRIISDLSSTIQKLETDACAWKQKAAAAESEKAEALASANAIAERQFTEQQAKLDAVLRQLDDARAAQLVSAGQNAPLTDMNGKEHATEVEALEQELAALKQQMKLSEETHASATEVSANELASLRAEIESLQSRLSSASAQANSHEEMIAALSRERDDLQEMCDMQEEELNAEKAQSDELSNLLKTVTDERTEEKCLWGDEKQSLEAQLSQHNEQLQALQQEMEKWRRQCQLEQERVKALSQPVSSSNPVQGIGRVGQQHDADGQGSGIEGGAVAAIAAVGSNQVAVLEMKIQELSASLDSAQLQIFQLQKSAEASADLTKQYGQLSMELEATKRKAKKRVEALTQDYEEALEHVRGFKDKAQQECVQLRAEVQRLTQALATTASPHSPAGGESKGAPHDREGGNVDLPLADSKSNGKDATPPPRAPSLREGDAANWVSASTAGLAGAAGSLATAPAAPPAVVVSSAPLSDWERERYEQIIFRLHRQLLTEEIGVVCDADGAGERGADVAQRLKKEAERDAVRFGNTEAGHPVEPVLDFSTAEAQVASLRALSSA